MRVWVPFHTIVYPLANASLTDTGFPILDAMGTLRVMGLAEEYKAAEDWLLSITIDTFMLPMSFATAAGRVLGSLVAAASVSPDLLSVAQAFADQ